MGTEKNKNTNKIAHFVWEVPQREMTIIEKKINKVNGLGLKYTVDPNTFVNHSSTEYEEHTFKSEREKKNAEQKIASENDLESLAIGGGISVWGLFDSRAKIGRENQADNKEEQNFGATEKSKKAVRIRRGFQHVKHFKAKVSLDEECKQAARNIVNRSYADR